MKVRILENNRFANWEHGLAFGPAPQTRCTTDGYWSLVGFVKAGNRRLFVLHHVWRSSPHFFGQGRRRG